MAIVGDDELGSIYGRPHIPNYTFGFHTPFEIGKDIFSAIGEVPKITHKEQDGIFRFGRNLLRMKKLYTEKTLFKEVH